MVEDAAIIHQLVVTYQMAVAVTLQVTITYQKVRQTLERPLGVKEGGSNDGGGLQESFCVRWCH